MNQPKQTAVEFLESTFLKRLKDAGIFISQYDFKLFERAKEMERNQTTCKCDSDSRIGETKLWCCNQCGKRTEKF